jgi:hypothetical protein
VDTCYGHSLKTGADAFILKASVPVVKLSTDAGGVPLIVTANLDALAWASDEAGNGLGLGASLSIAPRSAEAGSLALTGGVGYLSDLGLTVYAGIKLISF